MRKYAYVALGRVIELVELDDDKYIYDYYHPDTVWIEVTGIAGIEPNWSAEQTGSGWSFHPYVEPPPTDAEIADANIAMLQHSNQLAAAQKIALTNRIGTINDAIELEIAEPEEIAELPVRQSQLLEWKRYAVYLGRVTQQEGWALTVEWPVRPQEGMDLTVSAVAPSVAPLA